VIVWKDFILDDFFGPTLSLEFERQESQSGRSGGTTKSCEARLDNPGVMEDANGNIQETGQEKRPARMAGSLSLDSTQAGMDAGREDSTASLQGGGEVGQVE